MASILGTAVLVYGERVSRLGRNELRCRLPGMMLLIAMAITVAYGASLAAEFGWLDLDSW